MRYYFSDDTCAGRCPWDGNGYLPPQVSSGFLLGVMPDGTAIWASIHCGDQTPRPLARSGVTQDKTLRLPDVSQDPWRSEVSGPSRHRPRVEPGDAVKGIRRSPDHVKLPPMPFHGPGQDPSGWDGVMILRARVGVTTLRMSRLVESLSWPVKSRMASRSCAEARAEPREKWEATNPHHRPLVPSGRREADSATG